jgi:hypothetical protein
MLPRPRRIFFSLTSRVGLLAGILLLLSPIDLAAQPNRNHVVIRDDLSRAHREQLVFKLRGITGFPDLKFDDDGIMREGSRLPIGGSETARALVVNATSGRNLVVIEDTSNRPDVAFCRVIPGRWKKDAATRPPAVVVQIDFADFDQVVGDERALEAFNVGWGLLHELDHIVNDTPDAASLGETGECEAHINQMRRECNLPERTDYFSTLSPLSADTTFITRFVRLAFEEQKPATKKKKRYWIIWDANVVGGLAQNQIAALR